VAQIQAVLARRCAAIGELQLQLLSAGWTKRVGQWGVLGQGAQWAAVAGFDGSMLEEEEQQQDKQRNTKKSRTMLSSSSCGRLLLLSCAPSQIHLIFPRAIVGHNNLIRVYKMSLIST
jgi:hypothetical protein